MSRVVSFPAVAAAAWAGVAGLAVLHSLGVSVADGFTLCPVRLLTGHLCPGCGMGHSLTAAMRGDLSGSFAHHPMGLPLLVLWTAWLAWGGVNLSRGREFSEGFPSMIRRPAFAWSALAATLVIHVIRVV